MTRILGAIMVLGAWHVAGCGASALSGAEMADDFGPGGTGGGAGGYGGGGGAGGEYVPPCDGGCQTGFHCEFDTCIPDVPLPSPEGEGRSPLASERYVFSLDTDTRRLVRIDGVSLEVQAFTAGLAPMDLGLVGSRELSVLLDAFHLIEVLDHRQDPPVSAVWSTAWSMSHLALSPSGEHAVAYYDWDDTRSPGRQPEAGNINQVSVLYLGDGATPFADDDPRLEDTAVGFLPRDVRFAADGSRALVICRDELTPIDLGSPFVEGGDVATPGLSIAFDGSATEILVDPEATRALLRYQDSTRLHVVDLATGDATCFEADGAIGDMALTKDGRLAVQYNLGVDNTFGLAMVELSDAVAEPCAGLTPSLTVTDASRLAIDPAGAVAVAYEPDLGIEQVWRIDLLGQTAEAIQLEKAVQGLAFVGDGRFVLASHLKRDGTPDWSGDPEAAVDRAYGVTWIDLQNDSHRLLISEVPLGSFSFVPATEDRPGATYQAVSDIQQPQLLRVTHEIGFDETWVDLAATPLDLGYLAVSDRIYATQDHPWGRVTFIDAEGGELRHVTGFAIGVE